MAEITTELKDIKKELFDLQSSGGVVIAEVMRAHRKLYKHLSKLYFWWCNASVQEGYLKSEYATLGIKYWARLDYGINFRPLLVLAYGDLDDDRKDCYSRALNVMNDEVNKYPEIYAKGGIEKLVEFIVQEHGLERMADTTKNKNNSNEVNDNDEAGDLPDIDDAPVNVPVDKSLRNKVLLALTDYLDVHGENDEVKMPAEIKSNPQNFSVMLVQHTKNGLKRIDMQYNEALIEQMLVNNLSRRFEIIAQSIRPLLELIQTQCLPKTLESLDEKLVDKVTIKEEGKRKKSFMSYRRVMYRHETNEFILSPQNALTGMVSTIKPFFRIISDDFTKDVYMEVETREKLEKKLLRNFEFNFYNASQESAPIEAYPELDSAAFVVNLRHRINPNDLLCISFWPFNSSLEQPQDQLIRNPDYEFTPTWHAHIDRNEIKRVNDEFLVIWMKRHAKHLARPNGKSQSIQITFSADKWLIEFVYEDDSYSASEEIAITPIEVTAQSITVAFKSKYLVPALKSLADLPITTIATPVDITDFEDAFIPEEAANYKGGILFELNADVLCIKFSTYTFGGSEHTIYIPTLDAANKSSEAPFMRYFPELTSDESIDDETELDVENVNDEND